MKKFLRCFLPLLGIVIFLSCSMDSCSNFESNSKNGINIVCWNIQTFFDSKTCGTEYSDFKNSEYWNEERYRKRLSRLCDFMATAAADIYIFEELENEGVIFDIYNNLPNAAWDNSKNWNYGAFAKEPDAAIGTGIISRFPLEDVRIHNMDIRVQKESQPSGRPVLEATVVCGDKKLKLFANHWKSKASGTGDGEIWRHWQESVLSSQLIDASQESDGKTIPFIACGDFNKDINTFAIIPANRHCNVFLRTIDSVSSNNGINVYSPWLTKDGKCTNTAGSYYYKEQWEKIDHFFMEDSIEINMFRVMNDLPWATADGIPCGYKITSGAGYSDHLPLFCNILF